MVNWTTTIWTNLIQTTMDLSHNWSKPQWIQAIGVWDLIILYTREERSDRAVLATWPPGRRPVRFDPNHNEQFATMTQFTRLQELFNCIIVQMVVVQLTILVYHRSIDYCLIGSWSTGKCRNGHLFNCQIVKLVFGQLNIGEMAVCSVVLLLNCPFVQFFTLFSQFLFNRPGSAIPCWKIVQRVGKFCELNITNFKMSKHILPCTGAVQHSWANLAVRKDRKWVSTCA